MKVFKILGVLGLTVSAAANAAIVSVSGDITTVAAPASVDNDVNTADVIQAFDETQNVTLASDLSVDDDNLLGPSNTISAGTTVSSHMFFFDPATTGSLINKSGYAIFDTKVLGIITSTGLLALSDSVLGAAGTSYFDFANRGTEFLNDSVDFVVFSDYRVDFNLYAGDIDAGDVSTGDWVRVITAGNVSAVPVPAAAWLFGSGFVGLVSVARRRK